MRLQKQSLLSYSVVFPDRNDKIEDLLMSVPSNSAIEFISFLLYQNVNQRIDEHDFIIWAPWLLNTKKEVNAPIGHYAQKFDLGQYALIDKYAMLLLISNLLTYYNGRSDDLSEDDRSNLLLAYMICCDERLAQNKDLPYNNMTADEFVKNFMPLCLLTESIEAPRDYRLLLIKCYMLLIEFPKHNGQFAQFVESFCSDKKIPDAKKYLDEIFLTFLNLTKENLSNCLMEIDERNKEAIHFYDSLSIDTSSYIHDKDFFLMRERPILKTGLHRYNFMYMKLFLDKAFTGLLFDMKDSLVRKGILDAKSGYLNLKSFIGDEFSERFLFYTLMQKCFSKHYTGYTGKELEVAIGDGMPDYYLRKGNRIFLFECKDAQLAAKKKLSGDYEVLKDAIFDKYVRNTKGYGKGIVQLANVIESKVSAILDDVDKEAPYGVKYIFPVIVYFDDSFDVEGPNFLLNKEFRSILDERSISVDFEVKVLIMVNIEQLMKLENFFADGKLEWGSLINDYIDYKEQDELNQVFPFNKFLFQRARAVGYEMKKTRWFDEIIGNLQAMDKLSHQHAW